MKKKVLRRLAVASFAACAASAQAQVVVSEVAPWSSGSSPVGADWFELTNKGSSAINLAGWKMDDNSNSFASAVALQGVTSIGAGQSVIFLEGSAATVSSFISNWFGSNVPAGLQVGYYSGSGVGLGTTGDAVNIYNGTGALQANVSFGASPSGPTFATFDNAAGINGAISQLSTVGVNGAFVAPGNVYEIGSPGRVAPVPEPTALALMLAGLSVIGAAARWRRR